MLSSTDVSSLFAAQQSQFAQQNAYAQQLGMMAPQAPGSFFRPPPPSFPGMVAPPPSYSFAPTPMTSYSGGSRIAANAMAGLGGAASLGGAALGAASMFGKLGALGHVVDPFVGGMAGFSGSGIGALAGGGVAGAALGAAVPLGLAYGASKMVGSFIHGGQQGQMVEQSLGQNFGFMNAHSRTGAGFDRSGMQAITQGVRSLANIPEMMTSMEELTKLIPKMQQMGTMNGVRDAKEFSKRFREQVGVLRDMSKVLGSTLEEAADLMAHSKAVGMRGPAMQLQNAMAVKFTAAQTGMSEQQVMNMQSGGAQLAMQMGVKRSVGATAVTNAAQTLQKGIQEGRIGQEDIEDVAGGATGAEATGAAASNLTAKMAGILQNTAAGRAMMFGAAKFNKEGRYIGLDKRTMERLQAGTILPSEVGRMAQNLTGEQKAELMNRQGQMSLEMAGQMGIGGEFQALKSQLKGRLGDAGARRIFQMQGFGESEMDLGEKLAGMQGGLSGQEDMEKMQRYKASQKERTDPGAIMDRAMKKMHTAVFGRLEAEGDKARNWIAKTTENFIDDITGRAIVSISDNGAKRLEAAFGPKGKSLQGTGLSGGGIKGAMGGGLQDSELWSQSIFGMSGKTQTGRTSAGQLRHTIESLGVNVSGLNQSASERVISQRQEQLLKMGEGAGLGGKLAEDIAGTEEGSEFYRATNAKKMDLLQSHVATQLDEIRKKKMWNMKLTEDEAKMADLAQKTGAKSSQEQAYAVATALSKGAGIDVKGISDIGGAFSDASIKARAGALKEADRGMEKLLGPEGAAIIKGNPKLSTILSQMEGKDVDDALNMADPADAVKALEKMNIKGVEATDIESLRTLRGKLRQNEKEGNKGSIDAINRFVTVQKSTENDGFMGKVKEIAKDKSLTHAALKTALTSFGETGKVEGVQSAVADIEHQLMTGTEDQKAKLRESLGPLADQFMGADMLGKTKGPMTVKALAEKAGIKDVSELEKGLRQQGITIGAGGKIDVSAKVREAAASIADEHRVAGRIMGGKVETPGDVNKEMKETLTGLQQVIKDNTTVIKSLNQHWWSSNTGVGGDAATGAPTTTPGTTPPGATPPGH
jgi:hypothetical protein